LHRFVFYRRGLPVFIVVFLVNNLNKQVNEGLVAEDWYAVVLLDGVAHNLCGKKRAECCFLSKEQWLKKCC